MLSRGYRVGSSGCGLYKVPLVSESRLRLLRRHCVDVRKTICDVVPTFHGFVRASDFSHALQQSPSLSHISVQRAKVFISAFPK